MIKRINDSLLFKKTSRKWFVSTVADREGGVKKPSGRKAKQKNIYFIYFYLFFYQIYPPCPPLSNAIFQEIAPSLPQNDSPV